MLNFSRYLKLQIYFRIIETASKLKTLSSKSNSRSLTELMSSFSG